ncbi:MAG: rhomboid family intramembrane serine protease [Candidatus Rokubacteria bacterium]|nr:rhomboid family intramembrane serine protease [Candidatus Rokubacteria bacterium]
MLPLKDDIPTRSFPLVTVGLIAANILVFLYQLSLSVPGDREALRTAQAFVYEFGLIPCRLSGRCALPVELGAPAPFATVFTSMFLHGGLFHVGGNMLYLWIFGNNVEDSMGHGRFIVFYLLSGLVASLAQFAIDPASQIPMIGASGAVSGVLGAYLVMYPHARVLTLVVFGIFWQFIRVPAVIVLGFWIVVQLLNGLLTFTTPQQRGVAWFAHIGGFLAGLVLIRFFRRRPRIRYTFH